MYIHTYIHSKTTINNNSEPTIFKTKTVLYKAAKFLNVLKAIDKSKRNMKMVIKANSFLKSFKQ